MNYFSNPQNFFLNGDALNDVKESVGYYPNENDEESEKENYDCDKKYFFNGDKLTEFKETDDYFADEVGDGSKNLLFPLLT